MTTIPNRGWAPLALLTLLTGCSSGPSESDIRQALQKTYAQATAATGVKMEIVSLKKLGCAESGGGYMCDFELSLKGPLGAQTATTKARFVKGSDGWAASM